MYTFEHGIDFMLTFFNLRNLRIAEGFKIIFFKKSDFGIQYTHKKCQYYMDKQVEKQCDANRVKQNIFYRIKFNDGKDEPDEKTTDCKKCHEIFTSQTIPFIQNAIY